jgi:hypothetical protein
LQVDAFWIDTCVLAETPSGSTEYTQRKGFVEYKVTAKCVFRRDELSEGCDLTSALANSLCDDEDASTVSCKLHRSVNVSPPNSSAGQQPRSKRIITIKRRSERLQSLQSLRVPISSMQHRRERREDA